MKTASVRRRVDRLWVIWQTARAVFWLGLALLLVAYYIMMWTY